MDSEDRVETRMEKKEPSDATTRKRIKQSISIPFIWEQIPGTPKKDWKPTAPVKKLDAPPVKFIASVPFVWEEKPGKPLPPSQQPPSSPPPVLAAPTASPVKFIASVPFEWEEKPGKPLPSFSQLPSSSPPAVALPNLSSFPLSPRHSLCGENSWAGTNHQDGNEIEIIDFYPDSCESETDDSFSSATSLLADGLVPKMAVSNAVPVQETSLAGFNSGQLQSPASPASEMESHSSSYETVNTSLVGASFLEWLFPLLTPQSNFLEKVGCPEKEISDAQIKRQSEDTIDCERNYSAAIRKPHTLGELIMMSRRRSYLRKAVQMRTQDLSKEFMKSNPLGCCNIGSGNFVGRFQKRWTRQLQLKLM